MKQLLFLVLATFMLAPAFAQTGKRKSPHDTLIANNIKITYGRPYKNNREIFGTLEKYGVAWRAGADEATEITFAKDGTFGGKPVKAGTYTLFAIPQANEWTIVLNSALRQWGAYAYEKNKSKNVLEVKVPAKKLDNVVEQFTIKVESGNMVMEWDKTQVTIPVSF
jgi:Protein of unknown function (DUF2911)